MKTGTGIKIPLINPVSGYYIPYPKQVRISKTKKRVRISILRISD